MTFFDGLQQLFSGIKPTPVLLGAAIDIALTILFAIVAVPLFLPQGAFDLKDEQFSQAMDAMMNGYPFILTTMLLGCLASMAGAYVAARRAGCLELKHGLWVVIVSSALAFLLPSDESASTTPLWVDVLGWCLVFPAGVYGGHLARQSRERRTNPP